MRTAWTENRHRRSGTPSVQQIHCSSPRNITSCRMSTVRGRGRLQVFLHRTPTRSAKSSWCRLCNQNDISVTYGVTAAWYFATCHDDALQREHGHSVVLIFAYALIFLAADDDKEAFCDYLISTIRSVPFRHRLLLIGDFNVRVGHHCHVVAWPNVFWSSLSWP